VTFTPASLAAASAALVAEVRAILAAGYTYVPQPRKVDAQFDHDAEQEGGAQ
jgi:hypothetical protein